MRRAFTALLVLLLLLFTAAGMKNAAALGKCCQSVSLRYADPITADAVESSAEKLPGLTFWGEGSAALDGGLRRTQSKVIFYRGDASLVLGRDCTVGQLPALLDQTGCAVSDALAWKLFGSEDAVGLTLSADGEKYTVRAVFKSGDALALLPSGDAAFTAVELMYTDEAHQDPASWTDARLLESGLPEPDWRLYTAAPAAVAKALAWFPVLFAACVLAAWAGKAASRRAFPARDAIWFIVFFAASLALPMLLAAWLSWLTPSRWSDFAWWLQTAEGVAQQFEDFLLAPGAGRDLSVKAAFLAQLGVAVIQCALCEALRCRFHAEAARRSRSPCAASSAPLPAP